MRHALQDGNERYIKAGWKNRCLHILRQRDREEEVRIRDKNKCIDKTRRPIYRSRIIIRRYRYKDDENNRFNHSNDSKTDVPSKSSPD